MRKSLEFTVKPDKGISFGEIVVVLMIVVVVFLVFKTSVAGGAVLGPCNKCDAEAVYVKYSDANAKLCRLHYTETEPLCDLCDEPVKVLSIDNPDLNLPENGAFCEYHFDNMVFGESPTTTDLQNQIAELKRNLFMALLTQKEIMFKLDELEEVIDELGVFHDKQFP